MASRSLNKVMLIGNLTRDPELRYTANGTPVCVFGIATNRSWKDSTTGDVKEDTEFINLVAWNKLAEISYNLLAKGMLVFVEGEMRTRSYENSDGQTVYRTEIHVNDMQLLNDKGKRGKGGASATNDTSADEKKEKDNDSFESPEDNSKSEKSAKPDNKVKKESPKEKEEEMDDPLDDALVF
ncbi:single-stranded DNA-binding protein [Candidatus Dojkabacteria bacterium]|nr:single-stranded DNA-binding protein [Candidatus Dojkabacteria bacterium]